MTGQGRANFFLFFTPTITFLAVRLWSNKRIEKTLTQRYSYNAKKLTVIPIKEVKMRSGNNFFSRFQLYARAYVGTGTLRSCSDYFSLLVRGIGLREREEPPPNLISLV